LIGARGNICVETPNIQQSVLAGAFLVGCGSLALAGVTVFFTQ